MPPSFPRDNRSDKESLASSEHQPPRVAARRVAVGATEFEPNPGRELRLDEEHQALGHHAVMLHRLGSAAVCIAAITASMSATSMSTATRVGFCGSTNVRIFVTPSGPKNSSRFVRQASARCPSRCDLRSRSAWRSPRRRGLGASSPACASLAAPRRSASRPAGCRTTPRRLGLCMPPYWRSSAGHRARWIRW